MALPIIFKNITRQKEEFKTLKYFTMQKYNLQQNPPKGTKILEDIITL
jgi:hypothetical protein